METVSLGIRVDPWYGTIFLFLEQIAPSWRHGFTHVSWALAWMLLRCVINWWELRDALVDFPQRWQGIRQRRRTRALLCTLMLWCIGKGVFFRVENSFNFALLMNKIRSPDSYTRKLLCLFCRRIAILTVYKQIFWYLNFANHRTKESFVSTANKPLVGTLMTIGDVTVSIAIIILKENSLLRYRVNLWVSQTMLYHNQNLFLIVSCCFCSSASLQKF